MHTTAHPLQDWQPGLPRTAAHPLESALHAKLAAGRPPAVPRRMAGNESTTLNVDVGHMAAEGAR